MAWHVFQHSRKNRCLCSSTCLLKMLLMGHSQLSSQQIYYAKMSVCWSRTQLVLHSIFSRHLMYPGLKLVLVLLVPSEAPHAMAISPLPNRTNYLIMSPAPSQGVVVQGRLFQHTHLPSPVRKPVHRYSEWACSLSFLLTTVLFIFLCLHMHSFLFVPFKAVLTWKKGRAHIWLLLLFFFFSACLCVVFPQL